MSIPELVNLELKAFKNKKLKFKPGQLVLARKDEKQNVMVITNFLFDALLNYNDADYVCEWINSRGNLRTENYPEDDIIGCKKDTQ